MSDIEIPEEDDMFFDQDHIVFYMNDTGDVRCKYSLFNLESFQDLILTVLSGAINEKVLDFLLEDLDKQNLKEESIAILVIKKLLKNDDSNPIVKPSNFK